MYIVSQYNIEILKCITLYLLHDWQQVKCVCNSEVDDCGKMWNSKLRETYVWGSAQISPGDQDTQSYDTQSYAEL